MSFVNQLEINLIKLYLGELPLWKSYWIYYFLGNLIASLPQLLFVILQIHTFVYTMTLYLVLSIVFYILTCIGVWKSSLRYNGSKILSFLARFVIVIGIIFNFSGFKNYLGIIYSI